MAWRTGGGLLVVLALFAAVYGIGKSFGSSDPCGDPPVLAGGTHLIVADSCVDTISYEGKTYYVACVKVHPSRVGETFLEDGGETYFKGAAEIEGVPRRDGFILEGMSCRRDTTVAMSQLPTRAQQRLLERLTAAPAGQAAEIPLSATKIGFSLIDDRLGAAALLENATGSDATGIRLDVEFLDGHGDVLWTIKENLPFCRARTHCWWGSSWPAEPYADDAPQLARVRVTGVGRAAKHGVGRVLPFTLERRPSGSVEGFAPAKEGMAVLIASSGAGSYGLMVNVKEGFGFDRRITVAADMLPILGQVEAIRGFMYPMKIPLGS